MLFFLVNACFKWSSHAHPEIAPLSASTGMQDPREKRARRREKNDASTASNVCCLLASLHMTKYGKKKSSLSRKFRKKRGFITCCAER